MDNISYRLMIRANNRFVIEAERAGTTFRQLFWSRNGRCSGYNFVASIRLQIAEGGTRSATSRKYPVPDKVFEKFTTFEKFSEPLKVERVPPPLENVLSRMRFLKNLREFHH